MTNENNDLAVFQRDLGQQEMGSEELKRLEKLLKDIDDKSFKASDVNENGLVLVYLRYSPKKFYYEATKYDIDNLEVEVEYDDNYNVNSVRRRYTPDISKSRGTWKDVTSAYLSKTSSGSIPSDLSLDPRYIFRKGMLVSRNGQFYSFYEKMGMFSPELYAIALEVTDEHITGIQAAMKADLVWMDGFKCASDVAKSKILKFKFDEGQKQCSGREQIESEQQ